MRPRPPSYRDEIAGPILQALNAGECCSVVGISGVGKTNLIAHLQRPDVQRAQLGAAEPLRWALIDANLLATWDGWGLWEGLLESLARSGSPSSPRPAARRSSASTACAACASAPRRSGRWAPHRHRPTGLGLPGRPMYSVHAGVVKLWLRRNFTTPMPTIIPDGCDQKSWVCVRSFPRFLITLIPDLG